MDSFTPRVLWAYLKANLVATQSTIEAANDWEERHSKTRARPYYFNRTTGESVWDKPEGYSDPGEVRASHLLVKHRDSRRPASWKEDPITRSKEEALHILNGHRQRIVSGETDLATLAQTESDCSSAKKGGDLGVFGKGQMQAAFENATYALKVGELSEPIDTDSGVHLILRTG
ncbi:Peptidyl-prolyl cis-trans isomerase NIMA-interacting protein 1 [Thoreauomyces humboldtii]|nr:Peptidyl-prolyl cis-trans isomerase NIMA-interacting protein 1 [Thoreauomyces humboldtii]